MVDLEGQDHGPSSSSVGDNDDDFIVYSKEGNNARWFKKEGDEVSPEDILCEVETDNATVAMECTEEVFLAKIIHGDGAKVIKVGEVPLSKIKGTGSDGTIVLADIEDYLASSGKGVSAPPTSKPKDKATEAGINYTDLPISQIRKAAALALCKVPQCNSPWTDEYIRQYHSVNVAVQTEHGLFVPVVRDADKKGLSKSADEVKSFTQKAKENSLKPEDYEVPFSKIKGTGSDGTIVQTDIEDYLASSGKGISAPPTSKPKDKATEAGINYTDLPISQIRKAAALALCKVPQCNSSWTDEYIRQYHSVNVAMQTEHGLFVPVVRDADKKGLSKIADEVKSFTQKGKENSLKPEDYEGGTFTVSNLGGTYGIKQFCAIINPPQFGILAVGSSAIGAEWLKVFKGYVENPESMLL
ncbi:hypothetical protein Sjap_017903 [Stephania japonica]|uniref:Dihydrolipoamide acetyltransferase component of pyruvate dehydrogenase complex n=1 Tax=Stephania japonica TaxID=461633 RepID=A0AAP0I709_9MAGN